jgi:hypothetical protein
MAIKDQFYNQRPLLLFDPRASQRLDPRFKFTRASSATYIDQLGIIRTAVANQPRIVDTSGDQSAGLIVEEGSTNYYITSELMTNGQRLSTEWTWTSFDDGGPQAGPYLRWQRTATGIIGSEWNYDIQYSNLNLQIGGQFVVSFYCRCHNGTLSSISIANPDAEPLVFNIDTEWRRFSRVFTYGIQSGLTIFRFNRAHTPALVNGATYDIAALQIEKKIAATSYIPTLGSTATRAADLVSIDAKIESRGSIYLDARANSAETDNTVISAANAANEKLTLQVKQTEALFSSRTLVYSINDNFEPRLPLPVPIPGDQRNLITWGTFNYHYQADNYRFTSSLSDDIPDNLNRIGIGHDITDPTKGFNGIISRLYLWADELPPEIARGLVRGSITVPLDADTEVSIPSDAQVLVFNTQGNNFDADKEIRFQLFGIADSVFIDWGDGSSQSYTQSQASNFVSHTYLSVGVYLVSISGVFGNLRFGGFTSSIPSQPSDLVAVIQYSSDWSPTDLTNLFNGCNLLPSSSLENFPNTSSIQRFDGAFAGCSSLVSVPLLNTEAATHLNLAFDNCRNLTGFPAINTSSVVSMLATWRGCLNLTSFPLIDTSKCTTLGSAWDGCLNLAAFPLINTEASVSFAGTWRDCLTLTSFPLIDTSAGTSFASTWSNCNSLTSFPLIDTSAGTSFASTWSNCNSLTSFPLIDTSAGTSFSSAWRSCSSLTSFPLIDTSAGTNFSAAWISCTSLTAFPALNFDAAVGLASDSAGSFNGFRETWFNCIALADFPANLFDNTSCTRYLDAFRNCALTATSIENILVSINTANTSNGNLSLEGGTNAVKTTWTANANTAYDALVARGWTITFRP